MDKTKGYYSLVWKESWKDTFLYYSDKKAFLEDVIGGIFVSIISTILAGGVVMLSAIQVFISVALGLFVVFLSRLIFSFIRVPERIYKAEKKKADRYNWDGVSVSYEYLEDKAGYKIRIKSDKTELCYFLVELQYLELDGMLEDYKVADKSRMLLWILNPTDNAAVRDANRTWGVGLGLNPGFFELCHIVENSNGIRNKIVFCDWNTKDGKRPPKKFAYFSKFAKGELKLHGTYPEGSLSTGHLGSGGYRTKVVPEELIFRFRIDIENNIPIMKIFERNPFDVHAELEDKKSTDEG